jgi:hypothetical protein
LGGWAPGDTVKRTMILTNTGSLDAKLTGIKATARESFTQNLPSGGNRTINGLIAGDAFDEFIQLANVEVAIPDENLMLYNGSLAELMFADTDEFASLLSNPVLMGTTPPFSPGPLNITFEVTLDSSAGNDLQGQNFIFDFGFFVEQIRNNDVTEEETGTYSGQIVDALTGEPVSGLTLEFSESLGEMASLGVSDSNFPMYLASTESRVWYTTTDENGYWTIELPGGNYSVTVSGDGYNGYSFTINIIPNTDTEMPNPISVTPPVEDDQWRIVLTWGATPSDLDSHITGPTGDGSRFHVFYGNSSYYENGEIVASLDRDDVDGYGPETITTIVTESELSGAYRYSIHDYTRTHNGLANSNARVDVYNGNDYVATYSVPNQEGMIWRVFEIENGQVNLINQMLPDGSGF